MLTYLSGECSPLHKYWFASVLLTVFKSMLLFLYRPDHYVGLLHIYPLRWLTHQTIVNFSKKLLNWSTQVVIVPIPHSVINPRLDTSLIDLPANMAQHVFCWSCRRWHRSVPNTYAACSYNWFKWHWMYYSLLILYGVILMLYVLLPRMLEKIMDFSQSPRNSQFRLLYFRDFLGSQHADTARPKCVELGYLFSKSSWNLIGESTDVRCILIHRTQKLSLKSPWSWPY